MKKIWLIGLLMIVLCSFTTAFSFGNEISYSYLDDNLDDETGNFTWVAPQAENYVSMIINNGFDMNENSYINTTINNDWDTATERSIACWWRPTSLSNLFFIFSQGRSTDGFRSMYLYLNTDGKITGGQTPTGNNVNMATGTSTNTVTVGNTYFMKYRWTLGGNCELILNDTVFLNFSCTNQPFDTVDSFLIGADKSQLTTTTRADQDIDEIALFNKALSNAEFEEYRTETLSGTHYGEITPLLTTTLNYPINETTYYGTYNGSIEIGLNNVNGSALCTLNDTRWSFNSNDNTTYSFINNTAIIGSNITLFYNCTDSSGQQSNSTFWFYLDTILDITFYDESTLTKLNTTNITFQLISDLSGTNYTTDDGNYSLFTLSPGDYEINYFGDNYVNRQYYLTIIEGKKTIVTLYLINSTQSQQIIATLYDTYGNELPNYYIKTYRRINGVYYLVETSYTNSDGETDFYAILNTPMYYWQIWGIDDILYKQTTETEIYSTNLDYVISLTSPIGHIFNQVSGYLYSFTFDNTTNKWTYIFTDTTSLSTYNKLAVYDAKEGTLIASNGTISTSGTLVVDMNPYYVNGSSYIAKITANASPEFSIDSKYYTYFNTPYQVGLYGVFMTIIIVLLLTLIAFWNPAVMFIMQAFAIIITWTVGLHELSLTSVTIISTILIIFAYIVSDRT